MVFQEMHYGSRLLIVVYGSNGLPIESYSANDLEHSLQIQSQLTLRGYKGIMGYSLSEYAFNNLQQLIQFNRSQLQSV